VHTRACSQGELDTLRVNHDCTEQQREMAEKTLEEQRAELVKLRLALSELELLKESLLFQASSHEGTISSLKSQVRQEEWEGKDSNVSFFEYGPHKHTC